jgi:phosphoglycolate phosphatase
MKYDALIFDLDGTLWNATGTVARGWINALMELQVPIPSVTNEDISKVAGQVYEECVRILLKDVKVPMEKLLPVLKKHEEKLMMVHGGTLYDGVTELLPELAKKYKLYLVSNCQDWYLESFFKTTDLKQHFLDWDCHGCSGRSKADNIVDVVRRNNLKNPVYLGDTQGDYESCQKAGVDFIFCQYGFGKVENVPTAKTFEDITNHL